MKQIAIKRALLQQFRGRETAWIVASVVGSILVAVSFFVIRPTCGLMFYPTVVARNYVIAWICLLVFIGVTNKVKLIFGVLVFSWLGARPLIEYRIPTNERRAVRRLREMQGKLRSANTPTKALSDIIGPDLGKTGRFNGYEFEYLPEAKGSAFGHYIITARPQCYCATGQHSFILDDSGSIHHTGENRAATFQDPVVRQD